MNMEVTAGFYLDNRGVADVDFSQPWEGNPGTGAAEYLHVALPYFIQEYTGIKCHIFAHHINHLPKEVQAHKVSSIRDAAAKAKQLNMSCFVFRPRVQEEDSILDYLDEINLFAIGRAALTPSPEHIRRMARCKAFKILVCVGREQYDYLLDTPIHDKISCINNGVVTSACSGVDKIEKDLTLVTYMGALVPQKGFHLLAEAWPKVIQSFPDAKLSVIGSVQMYNEKSTMGPLGVAEEFYERGHILPHLTTTDGKLHPSVQFHGRLGKEKYEILRKSLVGVANPSGQTETCCVSAVEMAACEVAVVSGAYYALLDTVYDGETGLLGETVTDLGNNIVSLLKNPPRAIDMGFRGKKRAFEEYDFFIIAPKWAYLFQNVSLGKQSPPSGRPKNIFKHLKFLRILNTIPQKTIGRLFYWPSVQEVEFYARKFPVVVSMVRSVSSLRRSFSNHKAR